MPKKSRDPNNFNCTDYISWYLEIIDIRERLIATGEWPMHLDTDFVVLRNELIDADADYEDKQQHLVKTATPLHEDNAKKVYKRIVMFKRLLPTLFDGDETVLTEFSINIEIPVDRDDLFIMAKNCLDHWNELCDPVMPPVYAPVEAFFASFATEFSDFEAAHEAHIDATREKEIAETLVETKRDACHKAERLVFTWFRGIHIDPEEKWWEDTPWGTASGGGEEPVVVFPAKPTGFDGEVTELEDIRLWWLKYAGAKVNLYRADGNIGGPALERPAVAFMTGIINESFTDTNLQNNRVYYYWICAVVEGVEGEFAGPVVIEYKKGEDIPR